MVDVVLRGGRSQRIDVRLGRTAYTPSAITVVNNGVDPATLAMEGLWRANFPGSPWPGTPSNGGSGTTPGRDLEAGNVGGGGTPVNGWTPFNCNGASIYLVGHMGLTWGDLIGATNGDFYLHVLAHWNTAAATIDPLSDAGILSDNGGSFAVSYSTSGVAFSIYDNAGTPQLRTVGPVSASAGASAYHLIQVWWDSAAFTMWIQVDGGTAVSADLFSSDFGAGNAVTVGSNWSLTNFLDGDILEIALAQDKFDATTRSQIRGYVQTRYGLSMGYSGTTTFPNTTIHPTLFRMNAFPTIRNEDIYLYVDTDYVAPTVVPTYTQWVTDHVPSAHQLRPRVPVVHQQHVSVANIVPIVPPAAPALVDVETPDAVRRATLYVSALTEVRGPIAPERKVQPSTIDTPDIVRRPALHASQHPDATRPPPAPEQRGPMADTDAPDRVLRPTFATSAQQATTTIAPAPEQRSAIAIVDAPVRVPRPFLGAWLMPDVTRPAPAPERNAPLWSVDAPERPIRATFAVAEHQPVTTIAPQPERQLAYSDALAPERVLRVYPSALYQQDRAFYPVPIINVVPAPNITPPSAPDRVMRPSLGTWLMQDVAASMRPEAPLAQVSVSAPDRIDRPTTPASRQPTHSAQPLAPERTSTLATVDAPVAVSRPAFQAQQQQGPTTLSPAPERTAPLSAVDAPGMVVRPWYRVHAQQVSAPLVVAPERTTALAAVDAPMAVLRPVLRTEQHQAFTTSQLPPPAPLGVPLETHPDTVSRPTLPAHQQPTTPTFWPFPLPNLAAPAEGNTASYPDRVLRPTFLPALQWASWIDPLPRTAKPVTELAPDWTEYPDRAPRAFLRTDLQQSVTTLSPKPERTATLFLAIAEDIVRRPLYAPPQQQPLAAPVRLERTTALADVQPPDRVPRPTLHAVHQQAVATSMQVEVPRPQTPTSAPDRITRPTLGVAWMQDVASIARPERTSALATVSAPDIVLRPTFQGARQHHVTASPYPERPLPLPPPVYPDRVDRRVLRAEMQVGAVLAPLPPAPVVLSWQPVYVHRAPPPLLRIQPASVVWAPFTDFPLTTVAHLTSRVKPATVFLTLVLAATDFTTNAKTKPATALSTIIDRETWLVRFTHDVAPATSFESVVSTMELHVGDTARVDTTIKVDGVLTDPSSLTCEVQTPSGTKTTYSYPSANLVKLSTGSYRCLVDCTESGTWRVIWSSPGPTAKGADYAYFDVTPQPFTP